MLNCLINVVYMGLSNSTFRSYGKERPVPKIRFIKMTEVLSNTRALCRPEMG